MKRVDSLNTHSRYFRLSSPVVHKYCCGMKSPLENTYEYSEYGHRTFEGGARKVSYIPTAQFRDPTTLLDWGKVDLCCTSSCGWVTSPSFVVRCCCGGIMLCKPCHLPALVGETGSISVQKFIFQSTRSQLLVLG